MDNLKGGKVGEPTMLGKGHGSGYLRQLAIELLANGAPEVVIDPEADNIRACRAYEKAGFGKAERRVVSGEAIMVMYFTPNTG